ncbi:hypothetical protein ATKI12_9069 [Kitasatospora sp. Ki12]
MARGPFGRCRPYGPGRAVRAVVPWCPDGWCRVVRRGWCVARRCAGCGGWCGWCRVVPGGAWAWWPSRTAVRVLGGAWAWWPSRTAVRVPGGAWAWRPSDMGAGWRAGGPAWVVRCAGVRAGAVCCGSGKRVSRKRCARGSGGGGCGAFARARVSCGLDRTRGLRAGPLPLRGWRVSVRACAAPARAGGGFGFRRRLGAGVLGTVRRLPSARPLLRFSGSPVLRCPLVRSSARPLFVVLVGACAGHAGVSRGPWGGRGAGRVRGGWVGGGCGGSPSVVRRHI